jgi:hypothetical protein
VQNAYLVSSIREEKVMNLKSSHRFRGRLCLKNTRHGAPVPEYQRNLLKKRLLLQGFRVPPATKWLALGRHRQTGTLPAF